MNSIFRTQSGLFESVPLLISTLPIISDLSNLHISYVAIKIIFIDFGAGPDNLKPLQGIFSASGSIIYIHIIIIHIVMIIMPGFEAPHGGTIPPHILVTNLRPDLFIVNEAEKKAVFELTCPWDS